MGQDSDKQFVFEVAYGGTSFEQAIQQIKVDEESAGATVLFFGADDDEKKAALDALSEAAGLNVHQIDLETLIAERSEVTQGSVREIFDAAGEGRALLFLNNGDQFFNQEQEVEAEEDALTPVDYLLQRMESFKGIVVLSLADATHLQRAREAAPIDLVVTF